jgi:hypothetical protein
MSGKRNYAKKTLAEKAKTLQDLDIGMSVRACAAKYSIFVSTIVNWKKNKSEIINSISEFTSLFQKRPVQVSDNSKVIDERVYEWFANTRCQNILVFSPILQTKAVQVAANIGLNNFRALNGWLEAFRKASQNFVCCLKKTLEWSTTGNKTYPTLFKAMTQRISKMWTKLDLSGKVCQTVAWYYKEKSAKQARWPRIDLPLLFYVQQMVRSLSH